MNIKLYVNPRKMKDIENYKPTLVKQMALSQEDIEVIINPKDFKLNYQSQGIVIQKLRLRDKMFRKKE
jgi:hypothetical protein